MTTNKKKILDIYPTAYCFKSKQYLGFIIIDKESDISLSKYCSTKIAAWNNAVEKYNNKLRIEFEKSLI